MPDKQIAIRLGISQRTVRTHIERLFRSTGAHSRAHAVALFLATERQPAGGGNEARRSK